MFIEEPDPSPERDAMYDEDIADVGFVMNLSRAWAWVPGVSTGLFELLDDAALVAGLSSRDEGVLITALASTLGDSYCSLAWGTRLARATDPDTVVAVIKGQPAEALTEREMALAGWARKMAADPNSTTQTDVDALRHAGMSDGQISATTAFVALRIAFSTFNDAIGAAPDLQKLEAAPPEVASAIDFGRVPAAAPSVGC
jgi:alkylhydroperoxidase family enzyme